MSDSYNNRRRPYNCTTSNGLPRLLIPRPTADWPIPAAAVQPPQQYYGQQVVVLSKEQEKRLLEAWTTKLARTKRKMARQIRAHLKTSSSSKTSTSNIHNSNSFSSSSSSSLNDVLSCEDYHEEEANPVNIQNQSLVAEKLDFFTTPDNKRLRMLLTKELKNSDVGSLGRIVLPKREAEDKLPRLYDKEGIQVMISDIYSDNKWGLRYKYWTNNKSRMYVLENTGDFVKQNGLAMGDSITLYEDECKNLYVAMKKRNKVIPSETSCNLLDPIYNNQNDINEYSANKNDTLLQSYRMVDEEDITSLAFIIEQLDRNDHQEATTNTSLHTSTHSHFMSHNNNSMMMMSAVEENFDDCYGGLGTLPEVDQYKYYGYATLFDPMVTDDNKP